MMQTSHKIAHAQFNISFSSANEVIHGAAELPGLIKGLLLPRMDKIFNLWGPDHGVLRIQNLSVNLGTVAYEDLTRTLAHRLRQALHRVLHDQLTADRTDAVTSAHYIPSRHAGLDLITHFLKTGTLPWTADNATQVDLDRILANLIDKAPQTLIAFLRRQTQKSNFVLKRLVRQFKPEILTRLAAHLAQANAHPSGLSNKKIGRGFSLSQHPYVTAPPVLKPESHAARMTAPVLPHLVNAATTLFLTVKPAPMADYELAVVLWESIMGQLLTSGRGAISPYTLIVNAVESLAGHHRMSPGCLRQCLIRRWRQRHCKSDAVTEKLIREMAYRMDPDYVDPQWLQLEAAPWMLLESIFLDAVVHRRMNGFAHAWSVMCDYFIGPTRQVIRKIASRSRVQQNIARDFTPRQFKQLVVLLEPRHADFIENVIDHQKPLAQVIPRISDTPDRIGARIKEFTLAYLLSDGTSRFNRKQYCAAMIRKLAAHHNMAHGALLENFHSFFSCAVPSNDNNSRQLKEILEELRGNPEKDHILTGQKDTAVAPDKLDFLSCSIVEFKGNDRRHSKALSMVSVVVNPQGGQPGIKMPGAIPRACARGFQKKRKRHGIEIPAIHFILKAAMLQHRWLMEWPNQAKNIFESTANASAIAPLLCAKDINNARQYRLEDIVGPILNTATDRRPPLAHEKRKRHGIEILAIHFILKAAMLQHRWLMEWPNQAKNIFESTANASAIAPLLCAKDINNARQYRLEDIVGPILNTATGRRPPLAHEKRKRHGIEILAIHFILKTAMLQHGWLMEWPNQAKNIFESTANASAIAPLLCAQDINNARQYRLEDIVGPILNTATGRRPPLAHEKRFLRDLSKIYRQMGTMPLDRLENVMQYLLLMGMAYCPHEQLSVLLQNMLPGERIKFYDLFAYMYPKYWETLRRAGVYFQQTTNGKWVWRSLTHTASQDSIIGRIWGMASVHSAKSMWMDTAVRAAWAEKVKAYLGFCISAFPPTVVPRQQFAGVPHWVDAFHSAPHDRGRRWIFSDLIRQLNICQSDTASTPCNDAISCRLHRRPGADHEYTGNKSVCVKTHHPKIDPCPTERRIKKTPSVGPEAHPAGIKQSASVAHGPHAVEKAQNDRREPSQASAVYIQNAGLVLTAPYLPKFFSMLGYIEKGRFKNPTAIQRAVHVLEFLVHENTQSPEFHLTLNKILCGVSRETPICPGMDITSKERQTVYSLILGMINHWKVIGKTSPEGLRTSFLQRKGFLTSKEDVWCLQVEARSYDMLLDQLPWSFTMIKYPWMPRLLNVNWRSS